MADKFKGNITSSETQKLKLLYLLDILRKNTDDEHSITMNEILAELEGYGVHAERKAIYTDIQALNLYGVDIIGEKDGRGYKYHIGSRDFELPELKLLVDAVQSSKFITSRKSSELIKKLEGLTSRYKEKELDRQVFVAGRIKTMNTSIYYNIDSIHSAISGDVKIRFKYFNWTADKEQVYRKDGADYEISPWGLTWDDDNYYLIGYDDESHKIKHYRVDKMKSIRLTDLKRQGKNEFKKRDIATYTEKRFGMYDAEVEKVTLLCDNKMAGVIIDRFGKDTMMLSEDDDHFIAVVDMALSPLFLGWIASMAPQIVITAPEGAVEEMKAFVSRLQDVYN